jgi:GT2 family glycosyltransferase
LVLRLLTCIVTYNRLEYTKKAVESYLKTRDRGDAYVLVDNGSTDGTREWILEEDLAHIFNDRNLFPGAATNIGWHSGLKLFDGVDLLHRSDNDVEYLPGWREEVEEKFEQMPTLGQLGLLNAIEDYGENPPGRSAGGFTSAPRAVTA